MGKIYRVRIEAYDPETEKTEVVLDEKDDENGYDGFMFFAKETPNEEGKSGLRSVVMHMSTLDVASIMCNEEMFDAAMKAVRLYKLLKGDDKDAT